MEALGAAQRYQFGIVLFAVGLHIDADLARFPARHIQLPNAEVVLVHNGFAVGRDGGVKEIAIAVVGHLHRLAAGLVGDLPDVVDALHHFGAAKLNALLIGQFVGDEVDFPAIGIHGPQHVAVVIGIAQLGEALGRQVFHPQVGRIAAAIVFARPGSGMARECHLLAVGRETSPGAPIGLHRGFDAAFHWNFPKCGYRRKNTRPAVGGEDDLLAVGRPAHHRIVGGVIGELLRLAARGRNHVHVVVAVTIRREGDPLPVRRESRELIARRIIREPLHVRAILAGNPDIAQIGECYFTF